jgi:hypothetical protein
MSGNNEKGKLYLELLPAPYGDHLDYEATIKNEKNEKVVSKELSYYHGNLKENSNGNKYGKWEIKSYNYKYEITDEGTSFFIFNTSYYTVRLHVYVDVISDELGLLNFEITDPITTMEKGEEHTFIVNSSINDGFNLVWAFYNINYTKPEILKLNDNKETGRISITNNKATITAVDYGTAFIRLWLFKGDAQVVYKDYKITVPYLAEKMELVDNRNFIYLDEYRHLLKIKFQPSYSTNEKVTVSFSKPILEVDFIPNDSPDQIWLKPLGIGNVTVTVTTENGITATKEYIVK